MKELWIAVGIFIGMVVLIGLVLSACLFVVKAWEHINAPHSNNTELMANNCVFTGVDGIDGKRVATDIKKRVRKETR